MSKFKIKDLVDYADLFMKMAQDPFADSDSDPFGPSTPAAPKTQNQLILDDLNKKLQDFKDSVANDKVIDGQYEWSYDQDKVMYQRRISALLYNITQNVVTPEEIQDELNKINSLEFTIEQKDQAKFLANEKADIKAEQDAAASAIKGKTAFSQQDATNVVNSHLNDIKALVVKSKVSSPAITFKFYNNGVIQLSSTNQSLSNSIRRELLTSLELSLKQYLIVNKKYFASSPISITQTY